MTLKKPQIQSSPELAKFKNHLYIFSFCEGLIFWYAIEKLFMQSIGLGVTAIITIGLVAQASKMIFEIPSSILADRWNRRNMLILGSVIMIIASVLLPFAKTEIAYLLLVLLWTIYHAFKSGTDVAFIFDSLKNYDAKDQFQHVLSRYRSLEYAGLVVSGLAAGFIAAATNLQVPFWLTILPLMLGMLALWRLPEPPIARHKGSDRWWKHATSAWHEVKVKSITWVMLLNALLLALQLIWYEFYQIYGLAVQTPQLFFGSLLAILCLGLIVGAEITRRITASKKTIVLFWLLLVSAHLTGFFVNNFISFLVVILVTMIAMQVLQLHFIDTINHAVGSTRRATIISLAGGVSQLLFLVLALLFRAVADIWSVQSAFLVASLPLIILGVVDVIRRIPWLRTNTTIIEPGAAQSDVR